MPAPQSAGAAANTGGEEHLLNTNDFKYALDVALNLGKAPECKGEDGAYRLFEIPFECKRILWDDWMAKQQSDTMQGFLRSDKVSEARELFVKALDADGDGTITPKDLQLLYDTKLTPALLGNQAILDKWLPFAGQCAFGLLTGLAVGAVTRRAYRAKFWIAGAGLALYSGFQYLAQQNFVNQHVLEEAFRGKVQQLADANGDGTIDREDLNHLVENRLRFISTKLGPGGFAPGAVGYATLALGFARGIRFI